MTDVVAQGLYRGAMTLAGAAGGVVSRLPLAPARWRGVGDRLGRIDAEDRAAAASAPALWLHAASVGELNAARPLLAQLRSRFPGRLAVVSTMTRTGLQVARALPEAHLTLLFPLDAPHVVRSLLSAFRLEAFLFTETEIWPVFLSELAERRIPAIMVSGRVSAASAQRARWLRPLYRKALATVTCCMQSEADAARIVELGADPRRVQVAGSLKFDAAGAAPPPEVERLAALLAARPVVVAGSTHPGEEELVLEAFARLRPAHPDAVLLLAPRHPERADDVAATITARGFALARVSALVRGDAAVPDTGPAVVLLDGVGLLAHCYALGVIAFVGGSLVPVGGHNVIEPARAGRPVLVGPHTANAGDVVDRLLAAGGGMRVGSAAALALAIDHLLTEPDRALEMGRRAWSAVQTGQGAVERHMKIIAARLESATFARAATG